MARYESSRTASGRLTVSKLPRPYIPLEVRLQVAERQLGHTWEIPGQSRTERLRLMLLKLFDANPCHLDHDPALQNREKIWRDGKIVGYNPPANDPAHLIYRGTHAHVIKTLVRGDGAQYSDAALARKNKRIERNRKGRPVQKIKSRGFR